MTLHDRLKEIPVEFNTIETGRLVLSDSTITAIIAAVAERLPGFAKSNDPMLFAKGWNAYRKEVLKVLQAGR